ncbi:hypothetical protein EXE63_19615 [Mycolicibacterium frederiksbergense]|uniref:Uncharacterized protein n=2 Tax=Mycolicibacterium frederiksbergense TaxID=117567 RepID=A0A6H0SE40_9MYCO|nr:hypothetical protein EXE63_19615 [Mycolicibacterium frederiksbergense]
MVVGVWQSSPFGAFADVMVQTADDQRLLLAPTTEVAEFVSDTYAFDDVRVGAVTAELAADRLTVTAADLDVTVELGGPARFDRLLRLVPGPLASAPWWLRVINPVAGLLAPGVHTAGTAGGGRREYYGVRRSRRIAALSGRFGEVPLGRLADLDPPVRFGFSSAPTDPQLVAVTTTIDMP